MKAMRWMCGLAVGTALVVGCDRSNNDPPKSPTPAPPAPDVTPKAGGAGTGATATGDASGGDAGGAAVTSTGPSDAPPDADAQGAERNKQVQELLDKAMSAMKDKKFDEARKAVDNAEAMSDSVDATLREQIKTARASIDNLEKAPEAPIPPTVPDAPKPPAPPAPDDENK